jgi:hypothetical protein
MLQELIALEKDVSLLEKAFNIYTGLKIKTNRV